MKTYTVFGVYADAMDQRVEIAVEANSPEEAEAYAREVDDTNGQLVVAGVVEGRFPSKGRTAPVTSLAEVRRRGFETQVARVRVLYETVLVPLQCPGCKEDLKKPGALQQWDYHDRVWDAHLPSKPATVLGHGVNVDIVKGIRAPFDMSGTIPAFALSCSRCSYELWNGYVEIDNQGVLKHRKLSNERNHP